nr:acyltransferase family protein [Lachnospiraceae bacterium]
MTKQREFWIDAIKGLGIALMILGHMFIGPSLKGFIYSFHMPLFVLISGYLFRADGSAKDLILRKCKSILLPFLYCNIATLFVRLALLTVSGSFTPEGALGIARMQALMTLGANSSYKTIMEYVESSGPVWYLPFIFNIQILFILFAKIYKKKSRIGNMLELCAVLLLGYAGYHIGTKIAYLLWSFDASLVGLIVFYVGIKLREHRFFEQKYATPVSLVLGLFWIIAQPKIGFTVFATRDYFYYPLCIILALAACIFVVFLVRLTEIRLKLTPLLKPLAWCGRHSLLILIIHAIEFVHINWIESIQYKLQNQVLSYILYMTIIIGLTWGFLLFRKLVRHVTKNFLNINK